MFSLTQMCKIWEKQSFMNISRVSLSCPKLKTKKMQFQQDVQNFYDDDDDDDDDELFLWYFQPGPLSEILTIANLRHAARRV